MIEGVITVHLNTLPIEAEILQVFDLYFGTLESYNDTAQDYLKCLIQHLFLCVIITELYSNAKRWRFLFWLADVHAYISQLSVYY